MIEVTNLTKKFAVTKKQLEADPVLKAGVLKGETVKYAVRDLSFTVNDNEIFGLLGPNGAGKTTTLRCLATLLAPSEGRISVNGHDTVTDGDNVRRQIAFLTNELKLDSHFTCDYTLKFFGRLQGMTEELIERRGAELFDYFAITPFKFTKIADLSTGMKQKLSIAVSLVHDPAVIIFDEPTNGLDIITARAVTDYLRAAKKAGKTVIISTHVMHVAQKLADRLLIVMDGKCRAAGTLAEIYHETGTGDLEEAFFKLYYQHQESRPVKTSKSGDHNA